MTRACPREGSGNGRSLRELAAEFGVSHETVRTVLHGGIQASAQPLGTVSLVAGRLADGGPPG